jgi:hypothetical protein
MLTIDDLREDNLERTTLIMTDDGEIVYDDESEELIDGFVILTPNLEPEEDFYPQEVKIKDIGIEDLRFLQIEARIDRVNNIVVMDTSEHKKLED